MNLLLRDNDFDYLEFRLWIGLWSGIFCLVLVATDASFLVQYFTRFTEEGFSALISFIFIYDAFKKMIKLAHHNPINSDYDPNLVTQYDCQCMPGTLSSLLLQWIKTNRLERPNKIDYSWRVTISTNIGSV